MSTLATAVQARIATARLVQLTNPNSDSATTVDTTYLEYAVTDVSAEFKTYCSETFDAANERHLSLGVAGVVALLRLWKGQADGEEKSMEDWRKRVEAYAKTSSRRRVAWTSTGTQTPTDAPVGPDGIARPPFDRSRFRELDVDIPPASQPSGLIDDDTP